MKTLFIHYSEKVVQDKTGKYYTDGSYNMDIWKRYKENFGNIEVIFRDSTLVLDDLKAQETMNLMDGEIGLKLLVDKHKSIGSFLNPNIECYNRKIIRESINNSDFVIIRGRNNIAVKYAKKFNKPYLIEVVGCPFDSLRNHSFKGKLLSWYNYLNLKKIVKEAPYVTYVTEEFLQKRYPTKGKNISVSDVSVEEISEENKISKEKFIESSISRPLVISTVGAIDVRYKNQSLVIESLAILKERGIYIEYKIIGAGDNRYLKELSEIKGVRKQVKFLGAVPHKDVFKELLTTDIYVQPSKTEGTPRAVIEAMSVGCTVIGSDVGGIPELIDADGLFNPNDAVSLANIIENIRLDTLRKEFKNNLIKVKKYNRQNLDAKRSSFYKEILSELKDITNRV